MSDLTRCGFDCKNTVTHTIRANRMIFALCATHTQETREVFTMYHIPYEMEETPPTRFAPDMEVVRLVGFPGHEKGFWVRLGDFAGIDHTTITIEGMDVRYHLNGKSRDPQDHSRIVLPGEVPAHVHVYDERARG